MTTVATILEEIRNFPCALNEVNKISLFRLAQEVLQNGQILEIGACMGGSSAILAKGAPTAHITSYDIFVDRPGDSNPWGGKYGQRNIPENTARLAKIGIHNVKFVKADSSTLTTKDLLPYYDLVIVDGNHDYKYEKHDLFLCGPLTKVVYVHDYNMAGEANPSPWAKGTPDVKRCVHEFLVAYPEFYVSSVGPQEIILRRA